MSPSTNPILKPGNRRVNSEVEQPAPLIGDLRVLGKYRLLRLLGRGGMSEVHQAYDDELGRIVAIKVLADHLQNKSVFVSRFRQESKMSQELEHPHLVKCFGADRDPKTHREYMVLEYVDGRSVQDHLDEHGRLDSRAATRIMLDIAKALEFLHRLKYVHRDVKPGNILLDANRVAKLADLGVAKSLNESADLTSLDQGIGTPYYMAWEQMLNAAMVDARSDLYALGATYYHMLTGRVPFLGETESDIFRCKESGQYLPIREIYPELPDSLERIIARLLAHEPEQRFQSATELIETLTTIENSYRESEHLSNQLHSTPIILSFPTPVENPDQATRVDMKVVAEPTSQMNSSKSPIWFIKLRKKNKVTEYEMAESEILKLHAQDLLPSVVYAARSKESRFRPLHHYPEFHALAKKQQPTETAIAPISRTLLLQSMPQNPSPLKQAYLFGLFFVLMSAVIVYCILFRPT